jgi:glycosyltransferase involved in cell wall biosynthesis
VQIALVHDYLNQYGGAERVLEALHDLFPDAPVYTSIHDATAMPSFYRTWDIRTTWMQKMPGWRRFFRHYFMLYPWAFESLPLRPYQLIISSSSAYAKGIIPAPGAIHLCYCHTPMRFAWQTDQYIARENIRGIAQIAMRFCLHFIRSWDVHSARRVTHFIANSRVVADRIRTHYQREATIIPPPVDLAPFQDTPPADYLLTGGRLVPYKRIDLAVRACTALGVPLVVFGEGRDKAALMAQAGPNVRFVGRVSEAERLALFAGCRGFLFPGEEDFGITPLEAMAAGRPVLAYHAGGALDTVIAEQTGIFFMEQQVDAVQSGITQLLAHPWDAHHTRRHAEQFSRERFMERMRAVIAQHGGLDV